MPKRSSKPRGRNSMAVAIVAQSTDDELVPDPDEGKNSAAVALGRLGGQKGGKARAAKLTAKRRSAIAKKAAVTRWSKEPRTPALNRYLTRLPGADPEKVAKKTIEFRVPGGPLATGYEATLLIEICDLYLAAREAGNLSRRQAGLAEMAEIIVRATAKLGIIALIDEATGYQAVRSKQALQLKLQAFIADDMAEWAQMFPTDFWLELARLEGIKYSPRNRPIRWGRYIMMFVYDAVDSDVGKELRKINPDPHFRKNHHQWLKQHGREKVNNQVQQVIAIMKLVMTWRTSRRNSPRCSRKGRCSSRCGTS